MECKNCQSTLSDSSDFCQSCGGKVIRNRLTLKNLLGYFTETYFNYDNRFLQTCLKLITVPEDVIGSYIDGVRKKYVNPVSFLAISFTLSGIYLFFFKDWLKGIMDFSNMSTTYEGQEKLNEAFMDFIFNYNSLLYFLIIPGLALISWIVFLNKKYNYTEHIVIYLYTMSFCSIVSILLTIIAALSPINIMVFSLLLYPLMFIYHIYLLKRLFELTIKQLILKILLFVPIFFIFYLMISILLVVIVILTGEIPIEELAPKK